MSGIKICVIDFSIGGYCREKIRSCDLSNIIIGEGKDAIVDLIEERTGSINNQKLKEYNILLMYKISGVDNKIILSIIRECSDIFIRVLQEEHGFYKYLDFFNSSSIQKGSSLPLIKKNKKDPLGLYNLINSYFNVITGSNAK